MDYLSIERAATTRGMNPRRLRQLCLAGRITGAVKRLEPGKLGAVYAIPPDFEILPGRPRGNPNWTRKESTRE